MDVGFGEALLYSGALLAVAAALSGLMHGTVLSISVLSVAAGLILAEAGANHVDGALSVLPSPLERELVAGNRRPGDEQAEPPVRRKPEPGRVRRRGRESEPPQAVDRGRRNP